MAPTIQQLISPELAGAAARIFKKTDDVITVYVHAIGGLVAIGGGTIGSQTIDTLSIDGEITAWMIETINKIDKCLDIDFQEASTSSDAKISIFLDREIELGDGSTTLGLALSNETRRKGWWEVILNGPALLKDKKYLKFAFIHEFGHVLGLEHPFDSSDGDIGGERFGAPDARETSMSYTKPADGWPDWYSQLDLLALVSLWGLEDDHQEYWIIADRTGAAIRLGATAAEARLSEERNGDILLGLAPPPPLPPIVIFDPDSATLLVHGLVAGGSWEASWDGGRHWGQGGPLPPADNNPLLPPLTTTRKLLAPSAKSWNLIVRQTDRWGIQVTSEEKQLSNAPSLKIEKTQLIAPEKNKPPQVAPLGRGPLGQPVIFWTLAKDTNGFREDLAEAIRLAIARIDACIAVDFQELIDVEDSQAIRLAQWIFSVDQQQPEAKENEETSAIGPIALTTARSLQAQTINNKQIIVHDQLQIQLKINPQEASSGLGSSKLEGGNHLIYPMLGQIGRLLGLQEPWKYTGLPEDLSLASFGQGQTVMAWQIDQCPPSDPDGLSLIDREALTLLHGHESESGESTEAKQARPVVLRITPLSQPVHPNPNQDRDITYLQWKLEVIGGEEGLMTSIGLRAKEWELNPGRSLERGWPMESQATLDNKEKETKIEMEIPAGIFSKLTLEVIAPSWATMANADNNQITIDVHQLELTLTVDNLIDDRWRSLRNPGKPQSPEALMPWMDSYIFWELDPSASPEWARTIRSFLKLIDRSCALHIVELVNGSSLAQLYVTPKTSESMEGPLIKAREQTKPTPKEKHFFPQRWELVIPNDETKFFQMRQAILVALGMERPEDDRDGDSYQKTPVSPADSALFTAGFPVDNVLRADQVLSELDKLALATLYGKDEQLTIPQPLGSELNASIDLAPGSTPWSVVINEKKSGLVPSKSGPQVRLNINIERQGAYDGTHEFLFIEKTSSSTKSIQWGQESIRQEIDLLIPLANPSEIVLQAVPIATASGGAAHLAAPPIAPIAVELDAEILKKIKTNLQADPLTGLSYDLNGNQRWDAAVEERVAMRYILGTFPGDALMADVIGLTRPTEEGSWAGAVTPTEDIRALVSISNSVAWPTAEDRSILTIFEGTNTFPG